MTTGTKPTIVVTGISGNLGLRLLRLLDDFQVIGVDVNPPKTDLPLRFEKIDVGRESACRQLVQVLKQSKARAVVHLAFIIDPLQTGVIDTGRMWQINVAGTARVMEAITEVNRQGGAIDTFIFPSSVSAYGPETYGAVKEEYPLGAHTLPYAVQKQEADDVVRFRAEALGNCATYVLRPHIFTGATMQNYLVGALRGTPTGKSKRAQKMRDNGTRLPLLCPAKKYLESHFQFLHVDDMARLLAYILRLTPEKKNSLTVLNVAGKGTPITLEQAAHIADAKIVNVPGRWVMKIILQLGWKFGISGIPPQALPYLIGSYTMDTSKLKKFLGSNYEQVIQHTVVSALEDCFKEEPKPRSASAVAKS
ncbi:MAG TPA: NAD-dependent epimerase/dehydratase family protein [Terriglobales bacterium]|nr:NAD-dependent epimerase/dehydratase family protein [Terriglobales bacterium]